MLPCAARKQAQRLLLERNLLFAENPLEVRHDVAGRHLLQIELQAARQHGDGNLLRIGRRENELDVRRLLERLQHRVERVIRQHVHFVDHVDLEARIDRRVHRALEQRGHLVDAAVARGVHLDVVDEAAFVDLAARADTPHGCDVTPVWLSAFAKIRDSVVLPTPRVPVNR
jgi:hypothetical protein